MPTPTPFEIAVAASTVHIGSVIVALRNGVAFPDVNDLGKVLTYQIFDHEGEYVMAVSTADLNYAIYAMKKLGVAVGKYHMGSKYQRSTQHTAFTFSWVGWL